MKRTLILAALAMVAACAEESGNKDILTHQEMVEIMEEVYITEEKVNHLSLPRDSANLVFSVLKTRIFENAALSDTLFKRSLDYYMEHPKELELIYTALVDSLQLREHQAPFRPDHQ